jgi:hypothetical protein
MTAIKIPPRRFWPKGFSTDFVTGFPDAPWVWDGCWYKPWTWFDWKQIDLAPAAWWHDLRYYLGWSVECNTEPGQLKWLLPIRNADRSELIRAIIDEQMERDFIRSGMGSKLARLACDVIVEWAGKSHYFWANEEELKRRDLDS